MIEWAARHRPGHSLCAYRVHLRFEDGVEGDLDLAGLISFRGVFAALKDESEFARLAVDPESGTIVWPSGADLDPDVLYAEITGRPIDLPGDRSSVG